MEICGVFLNNEISAEQQTQENGNNGQSPLLSLEVKLMQQPDF